MSVLKKIIKEQLARMTTPNVIDRGVKLRVSNPPVKKPGNKRPHGKRTPNKRGSNTARGGVSSHPRHGKMPNKPKLPKQDTMMNKEELTKMVREVIDEIRLESPDLFTNEQQNTSMPQGTRAGDPKLVKPRHKRKVARSRPKRRGLRAGGGTHNSMKGAKQHVPGDVTTEKLHGPKKALNRNKPTVRAKMMSSQTKQIKK